MLKVEWIKAGGGSTREITEVVSGITWGGSVSQAARTADISVIQAPNDKNILHLELEMDVGDAIRLQEDGVLLFVGEIITKESTSETGTVTYNCMDLLNHLLKSTGIYNFSNTTAEQITKMVCADFGIGVGSAKETNVPIKKMIIDGNTIYDIIMMAYTKAAKQTGETYICRMIGSELSVESKGEKKVKGFVLAEGHNITDVRRSETIENMINVIKIYDDTGKQIGEEKEGDWIKKYGIYQQVYKKEKGINESTAARNLLKGVEEKITLNGINGNLQCIAGNGVEVYDSITGLNGLFWIENDSHTWEKGIHTMSLELNFKNIMDRKEYEEKEES